MPAKVRKAVFPAAGLGTRFLPATKAQPKEMLPIVDKPIIQYGVEEAIHSGIQNIIIVTGRGKTAIEDHFDVSFELEYLLESRGKKELLAIVRGISDMINVSYTRQKEALGLGHAVLRAHELVGDEPFAVVLADDLIESETPCLRQLLVNLRGIDIGKNFALLNVAADVLVPLLQITVCPSINGRLDFWFEGSWENHIRIGIDGRRVNHRDVRNRHLFCLLRERLVFRRALRDCINPQNQKNNKQNEKPAEQCARSFAGGARLFLKF